MATYTITLNERSARGKALVEYLKALGVLMHKVSPKSATKHRTASTTLRRASTSTTRR